VLSHILSCICLAPVYRLFWLIFPLFFRWMPGKYFEVFSNHLSLILLVSSYVISAVSWTIDRESLNNLRSKQPEWQFLMFFVSSTYLFLLFHWLYFFHLSLFCIRFCIFWLYFGFCSLFWCHILVYSLLVFYFLFCFLLCTSLLIWRSCCVLLEVWFVSEYSTSSESAGISVWVFRFCYLRYT
jgi:hypothetical protein